MLLIISTHNTTRHQGDRSFTFHEYWEIEQAMIESAALFRTVPASKSSIESLKEVKVDDLDATTLEQCSVFLEKLSFEDIGTHGRDSKRELLCMSCSHLYHKDCIVHWLKTSHTSLLCRCPIPTST